MYNVFLFKVMAPVAVMLPFTVISGTFFVTEFVTSPENEPTFTSPLRTPFLCLTTTPAPVMSPSNAVPVDELDTPISTANLSPVTPCGNEYAPEPTNFIVLPFATEVAQVPSELFVKTTGSSVLFVNVMVFAHVWVNLNIGSVDSGSALAYVMSKP